MPPLARPARAPLACRATRTSAQTRCRANPPSSSANGASRSDFHTPRRTLFALGGLAPALAAAARDETFDELERRAKQSYYARDLDSALDALSRIIESEPNEPVWRERRAQVLVDLKRFEDAIADYDFAQSKYEKE